MENYILNDEDSFNLYKLLHRVIRLLEKNDSLIRHLELQRNNDLDLCVLHQDRDKLKNAIDQENDIYLDLMSGLVIKPKHIHLSTFFSWFLK